MKTALLSLWLLALLFRANATDSRAAPPASLKPPAVTITSVAPAPDKLSLIISYQIEGKPFQEHIIFAQEIAEFHYCRWTDDSGIAIVARTGAGSIAQASFSKDGESVRLWDARSGAEKSAQTSSSKDEQSVRVWDARTGAQAAAEYFYATLELSGTPTDHKPARIPAPNIVCPVLGIGNTFGDSVVITAVQHHRGPSDSISGWVFIDNCPRPAGVAGVLTPFTVSGNPLQPK